MTKEIKTDDGRVIEQDLRKELMGFWFACLFMTLAVIVPSLARATENVQVDRVFAKADATSSVSLQCGDAGIPRFTARIDQEAGIISVTFTDGDTDSAIILGSMNGILYARTTEGALLALKGTEQWGLSVDGGQSAVAGGTCRVMTRI